MDQNEPTKYAAWNSITAIFVTHLKRLQYTGLFGNRIDGIYRAGQNKETKSWGTDQDGPQ